MTNVFELPENYKKAEQQERLNANRNVLEAIVKKNREWEKIILDSRLNRLRRTPFYYSPENLLEIRQKIKDLEGAVYRFVENPEVGFRPDNNVEHILGNGVQNYSKLVDKFLEQNVKNPEDKEDKQSKDLGEKELRWFLLNKKSWDLTLYYLDYISQAENAETFLQEMTSAEGYLETPEVRELFSKIPQEDIDKLQAFNFLTRIQGWQSSANVALWRGMKEIAYPISPENFEEEFEKLNPKVKEFINKEKTYQFMLKSLSEEKDKQAA